MTREDREALAQNADRVADYMSSNGFDASAADGLLAAVAELRKVCGTCQHKRVYEAADETRCWLRWEIVPADGSGFCHRHEPKTEAPDVA